MRGYRNVVAKLSGRPVETPAVVAPQPPALIPVPAAVMPQRESITATHRQAAPTATQPAPQTTLMAIDPSALRKTPVTDAPPERTAAHLSPKSRIATTKAVGAPPAEVSVGPAASAHENKAQRKSPSSAEVVVTNPPAQTQAAPATGEAHVQISAPPVDPQLAERWAWERYERAFKAEQKRDYAQAAKDYEWIRDLRLPDGVGPSDVQARLDRVKQLLQQRPQQGGTHP
jgi:hypothetical protein